MAGHDEHTLRVAEDVQPDDLDSLQDEARQVLSRIQELYAELALEAAPGGMAEQQLRRLYGVRDDLVQRLGLAAIRVVAEGGRLSTAVEDEPTPTVPEGETEEEAPAPTDTEPPTPTDTVEAEVAVTAKAPQVPEGPEEPELDEATPEPEVQVEEPEADLEPEPEPQPRGEPANLAALKALAQGGLSPNWSQRRSMREQQQALAGILKTIGKPSRIKRRQDVTSTLCRVADAVARMDAWLAQPTRLQKALLGLVSSIARHAQDESGFGLPMDEDDQLRTAFSLMTAWSKEHRPGFVSGLSRRNTPDSGSWLDDARAWWKELQEAHGPPEEDDNPEVALAELQLALEDGVDERKELRRLLHRAVSGGLSQSDPRLIAMLTPYQSMLKGMRGLKTLKTRLRDTLKQEDDAQEVEDRRSPVPPDWPLFPLTRGKSAVIVGGDPRPRAAERICEAFELAEVTWEEPDLRRVISLADRIRQRGVDLVIILRRFISHRAQDALMPACSDGEVPVCVVDTGYGVTQVKLAMERYLSALV